MMTRVTKIAMLLVCSGLMILLISCNKDDGEQPTTAKVKGTITLNNIAQWAEYKDSGEVQLTVFPKFSLDPLSGWGPVPDDFLGPGVLGGTFALGAPSNSQNPLILEYSADANQATFELELDPGTYSALALGFRHNSITDPSLRTATLGVHWSMPTEVSYGIVIQANIGGNVVKIFDEEAPTEFTVEAGDEKTINFTADFGILPLWYR